MATDRWLPAKYNLPDGSTIGQHLGSGTNWEIYQMNEDHSILIVKNSLAQRWIESNLVPDTLLGSLSFGDENYRTITSGPRQRLEPVDTRRPPRTKEDGLAFVLSLRETRSIDPEVPLHDALYVERYSRLLPTWTVSPAMSDEKIVGRWLTGGVSVPVTSFRRISDLLVWLAKEEVAELVEAAGFGTPHESEAAAVRHRPDHRSFGQDTTSTPRARTGWEKERRRSIRPRRFRLSGRPELEEFFNDHVIDIVENSERYRALGVEFPTAIVLHGPPGCGKTFAVERLVEYLDWPSFYIDSNSIGSPYVHETSRKVGEVFDKAADAAPSIIVIDEMESYLADRQIHESSGLHHVEEVGEFLRRIPEAHARHILVIGMTNRVKMIDPAILRRGRFDKVIEVKMPSETEVSDIIESLLAKMPTESDIDTDINSEIVRSLTGRALSDTAFVVREAARLAARAGKSALDDDSLRQALAGLPPTETEKEPAGFKFTESRNERTGFQD